MRFKKNMTSSSLLSSFLPHPSKHIITFKTKMSHSNLKKKLVDIVYSSVLLVNLAIESAFFIPPAPPKTISILKNWCLGTHGQTFPRGNQNMTPEPSR